MTARADEALTLVARGSGGDFDKDFDKQMSTLLGDGRNDGLLAAAQTRSDADKVHDAAAKAARDTGAWKDAHSHLRAQDVGGNYPDAVRLAISGGDGSTADAFSRVDGDLVAGIDAANATFDRQARQAADGFTLASPGMIVLTLLLLAGVVAGLQQRIAEYR